MHVLSTPPAFVLSQNQTLLLALSSFFFLYLLTLLDRSRPSPRFPAAPSGTPPRVRLPFETPASPALRLPPLGAHHDLFPLSSLLLPDSPCKVLSPCASCASPRSPLSESPKGSACLSPRVSAPSRGSPAFPSGRSSAPFRPALFRGPPLPGVPLSILPLPRSSTFFLPFFHFFSPLSRSLLS